MTEHGFGAYQQQKYSKGQALVKDTSFLCEVESKFIYLFIQSLF